MTRWIGTEIREHHVHDGTSDLCSFLVNLEDKIEEKSRISILDIALKLFPARWWAMHKEALTS
jgi:hypothetical protein